MNGSAIAEVGDPVGALHKELLDTQVSWFSLESSISQVSIQEIENKNNIQSFIWKGLNSELGAYQVMKKCYRCWPSR